MRSESVLPTHASAPDAPVDEWARNVAIILDAGIWPSLLAVFGVALGAFLTHRYTLKSKAHEDNRQRLISAAIDSLQCADNIVHEFRTVAYRGPLGGGRIRDANDPHAEWESIELAEAEEHDKAATAALEKIMELEVKLRALNNIVSVYGPKVLTTTLERVPRRISDYFNQVGEDGYVKGTNTEQTMEDMNELVASIRIEIKKLASV